MTNDERTIIEMHTYARPAGSKTEQEFVDRFLTPLGFERDAYSNLVLEIGERPSIMFCAHIDTVHRIGGRQTLHYDGRTLSLSKKAKKTSNCLGADDTAGVWLITEMVKAGIEGQYVIHHAEESGAIGSADRAKNPKLFDGISACIAFDRYGYDSVITHQCSRRTASDTFARSFAFAIGDDTFTPDSTGVFTDSESYAALIPECTNISVGYYNQHTKTETLNVPFLIRLRDSLVNAKWHQLKIDRDPLWDNEYDHSRWQIPKRTYDYGFERTYDYGRDLIDLAEEYPHVAADILEQFGYDAGEFRKAIRELYGVAAQ